MWCQSSGLCKKSKTEIIFSYVWFGYFVRIGETEFSGFFYEILWLSKTFAGKNVFKCTMFCYERFLLNHSNRMDRKCLEDILIFTVFQNLVQHYPWLWINSTWIMSVYLNKIGHLSRKKLFHQLQKKYSDVWRVHFISLHKQLRFSYPAKYQQRIFVPLSTISTFCFEFKNDLFLFFFFFANYVKAVIRFRNRRGEN